MFFLSLSERGIFVLMVRVAMTPALVDECPWPTYSELVPLISAGGVARRGPGDSDEGDQNDHRPTNEDAQQQCQRIGSDAHFSPLTRPRTRAILPPTLT